MSLNLLFTIIDYDSLDRNSSKINLISEWQNKNSYSDLGSEIPNDSQISVYIEWKYFFYKITLLNFTILKIIFQLCLHYAWYNYWW